MITYDYKYLYVCAKTYGLSYGRTNEEHIERAINEWSRQGYRVIKYDVIHGGENTQCWFLMERASDSVARLLEENELQNNQRLLEDPNSEIAYEPMRGHS